MASNDNRASLRTPVGPIQWRLPTVLAVLGAALALSGLLLSRPLLAINADSPRATWNLQQFDPAERNAGETYAWSRPRAALALFGLDGRPLLLDARLAAPRAPGEPVAMLALDAGRPYGSFVVASDWRHYRLLLPADPTNERTVGLSATPFTPPGRDQRLLGVALSRLKVYGLPPAGWQAWLLASRPLYLALWPPVLYLALLRLLPARRQRLGLLLASLTLPLVLLAAATPLPSSYLWPTIWPLPLLALLLPFGPWLLRRSAAVVRRRRWQEAILALGLAIAIAGQAVLRLSPNPVPGVALLLAGTALAAAGLRFLRTPTGHATGVGPAVGLALAVITLVALALRLYRLDGLPLGLFRDEARHGLQAVRIWNEPAYRPIYVVAGVQLPALLFYLMAPVVGLLGAAPWTARLVPALAGAFTPLALWWMARPIWGDRVGLLAAAILASSSWALAMSRWAFPVTLDPLLMLLALGLLWRALCQRHSSRWQPAALAALASACAGLAAYTYHTGRFGPLLLLLAAAILLGKSRARWRRAAPTLVAACLAGLLVLAPLIAFVASDLDGYMYRVERVSLFKDRLVAPHTPVGVVASNTARYAGMWHVAGDTNGRHNVPGAPMLDPASGLLLLLGLLLLARRPLHPPTLLLAAWLLLGLVPGIFSGQAPHAMRSFDTLVPTCLLAAIGLAALLDAVGHYRATSGAAVRGGLLGGLACFALAWNGGLYFGTFASSRAVYTRFNVAETAIARSLHTLERSDDPALSGLVLLVTEQLSRRDVFVFAGAGLPLATCSAERCNADLAPGAILLIDGEGGSKEQAAALRALGKGAVLLGPGPRYPGSEQPIFLAYGVGPAAERAYELLMEPEQRQRATRPGGSRDP